MKKMSRKISRAKNSPTTRTPPYLQSCDDKRAKKIHQIEECVSKIDILFAKKFGRKHLIRCNTGELVDVDSSLGGKFVGLLFVDSSILPNFKVEDYLIDFYFDLNRAYSSPLEIVYVPVSSKQQRVIANNVDDQLSFYTNFISTLPWLSLPFTSDDDSWRSHLTLLYAPMSPSLALVFLDHLGNVLVPSSSGLDCVCRLGPSVYPFTLDRRRQLTKHFSDLCKETSMTTLLSSPSNNGFLIDRNFNKVPISHLDGKDVALYVCDESCDDSTPFRQQLVDIYNQLKHQGFEVVFINFRYGGGAYKDEISFNHAVRNMPWLAFPFRDDNYWSLRSILQSKSHFVDFFDMFHHPTLFIRAKKGEALLDPYGYHIIKEYGTQAYPFTRRAALRCERRRLKELTFDSFLKQAEFSGLHFSSLIRNNKDSGTEQVSLSDLNLMQRPSGVLLVFARSSDYIETAVHSLIDSYAKQESPYTFEVILVSLDVDCQSFLSHFSVMPWYAFPRQVDKQEYCNLMERTIKFDFFSSSHCIAFGPSGNFLRIGVLPESFERVFPFIKDLEFMNQLAYRMMCRNGWSWDVDRYFGNEDHMDWLDG